ncbi:MAG: class I SAM-dependent methyltransferase [Altibacter sp.]|uniref:THUMP-like domain-containing protein n=1 Tax=Altibacter sp. TaxID=2024823 RepID=UPI001E0ABBF9|nr:class I SAM-dependent methyltransferase [Altibacter sp.]MBZ0326634.1 class I SAM-dependent methyltransferase [Altibacter sp.]
MNKDILHKETQEFIINFKEDSSKLAFAGSPFPTISTQQLLQQIESRRRIEKKLPSWYHKTGIYYPPKINLEQTSSEITASYKATLVYGDSLADLTGGFGVDTYYFSKQMAWVYHFEKNEELSAIAKHNFEILNAQNIHCFPQNGLDAVADKEFDILYIDPSRRHDSKGKVFYLADCEPNVPTHLPFLLARCKILLLKTSPMLDISVGLSELASVYEIHIVAVDNEVKELLWLLRSGFSEAPVIKTINFSKLGHQVFEFSRDAAVSATYSLPRQFLYEPNAALMKSGGFNELSTAFSVDKLHQNSHLYTSDAFVDFPGRCFKIENVVSYSKKAIKQALTFEKAHIATRNFPESVASLRKKWKLKDGGTLYLFFTKILDDKKVMLVCSKREL